MKQISLLTLVICLALLAGCENSETAGAGNQERKRMAAMQRQQQEAAQIDDTDRNLWNAQEDVLNRDSNPARSH